MATNTMATTPTFFDDLLKPWNEWFEKGNLWSRINTVPAVNIKEKNGGYELTLGAPGLKKEDFQIRIEGRMLTISAEQKKEQEEKNERMSRREYNYSSFSRSFNLPEDIREDGISANYENGELRISLPRNQQQHTTASKTIAVS